MYLATSLNRNWKKFIPLFELRNRLVHGKQPIRLSPKKLKSLSNYTMNFMDTSQIVCNIEYNEGLQADLALLRRKKQLNRLEGKKAQVSKVFTRYLPPARYPIEK